MKRFLPLQKGFDDFYGLVNTGIDFDTHERYGVPSMFRNNELTEEDKGTYRITDGGTVCVKWSRWRDQKESCGHWYRDGEKIKIFDDGGNLGVTVKIRKGNPEKLQI